MHTRGRCLRRSPNAKKGRGTYMKIKSLGDAKILKLDPYFSKGCSKKIKKSIDFRT